MTNPQLTLTYFHGKGRAEPIRLAFAIAGVKFEDVRITFEEFPKLVPTFPVGALPVLQVDNEVICQSKAILRYAASFGDLYPQDVMDRLRVDELIDTIDDMIVVLGATFNAKDEEERMELRAAFANETIPRYIAGVEKFIQGKFCVGDKLSIADLMLYGFVQMVTSGDLDGVPSTTLDRFTKVMAVSDEVSKVPAVKEWEEYRAKIDTEKLNELKISDE